MSPTIGVLDIAAGAGVLVAAAVALTARHRLVAAVAFLMFGTLLALVWALLRAPDVALAEAVLGAGVTGALLIDAASRRPSPAGPDRAAAEKPPRGALPVREPARSAALHRPAHSGQSWARRGGVATLLLLPLAGALAWSFGRPGAAGEEPARRVLEATPASGVDHPVTAVLLAFRAYDTLLEIAVLVGAAVVVMVLGGPTSEAPARRRGWNILEVYVRALGGLLVLIACWYLAAGSSRPGGAFQAGALLAGVLIVVHAAGIRRLDPASRLGGPRLTRRRPGHLPRGRGHRPADRPRPVAGPRPGGRRDPHPGARGRADPLDRGRPGGDVRRAGPGEGPVSAQSQRWVP